MFAQSRAEAGCRGGRRRFGGGQVGIKVHDILTTFDDEKLYSAEQLAKLVHSDTPGREVVIGVLRDGKVEQLQAKLGEAELPRLRAWTPPLRLPNRFDGPGRMLRRFCSEPAPAPQSESVDSLPLKNLGNKKLRADVVYLDKEGNARKHVFEGTREELRKAIESEKDLKPGERAHLLYSLNLRNVEDESHSPASDSAPFPAGSPMNPTTLSDRN